MELLDWLMGLEWWQVELLFWAVIAAAIACLFIPDGIAWVRRLLVAKEDGGDVTRVRRGTGRS